MARQGQREAGRQAPIGHGGLMTRPAEFRELSPVLREMPWVLVEAVATVVRTRCSPDCHPSDSDEVSSMWLRRFRSVTTSDL